MRPTFVGVMLGLVFLFTVNAATAAPRGRSTGPCRLVEDLRAVMSGDAPPDLAFDRDAVEAFVRRMVGGKASVDAVRLGELFDAIGTRGSKATCSITASEQYLAEQVAGIIMGGEVPVDEIRVVDLLDRVESLLASNGSATALVRRILGGPERRATVTDAASERRRELQLQYAAVENLVKRLRKEGVGEDDPGVLYQQAFDRLLAAGREELVPLLGGYRYLEQETAAIDQESLSLSQRTARVQAARRAAFGPDTAADVFLQDEALEGYEIDRHAIESDPFLSADAKAAQIEARRAELKVELAAAGSFVGFVDGGPGTPMASSPAGGDTVDRTAHFDSLPSELQQMVLEADARNTARASEAESPTSSALAPRTPAPRMDWDLDRYGLATTACDLDPNAVDFQATVDPSLLNALLASLPAISLNQAFNTSFSGLACSTHRVRVSSSGSLPIGGSTFVVTPSPGKLQVRLDFGGPLSAGLGVSYTSGSISCGGCSITNPLCCAAEAACAVESAAVDLAIDGLSGGITASAVRVTQVADTCVLGDCTPVHPLDSNNATLTNFVLNLFGSCSVAGFNPCSLLNTAVTTVTNWLVDFEGIVEGFFVDGSGNGLLISVFSSDIILDGCLPIPEVGECLAGSAAAAGLVRGPKSVGVNGFLYLLPLFAVGGAAIRVRRRRQSSETTSPDGSEDASDRDV